jgi:glycosyltransferase involved in cell wall biosynthesis
MKLTACYIVLNEEDWLKLSLQSIYDQVDKIIIIEGSQPGWGSTVSDEGLSTDKTREIIEGYPDTRNKIKYIRYGKAPDQATLRNQYLAAMPPDTDWFLQIDGDELYGHEDLLHAKQIMSQIGGQYGALAYTHWFFWGDPFHINHIPNSMIVRKCFKFNTGMKFVPPESLDLMGVYPEQTLFTPIVNMYHLGWARSPQRIRHKVIWTMRRHMAAGRFTEFIDLSDEELLLVVEQFPFMQGVKALMGSQLRSTALGVIDYFGRIPLREDVITRWEEIC